MQMGASCPTGSCRLGVKPPLTVTRATMPGRPSGGGSTNNRSNQWVFTRNLRHSQSDEGGARKETVGDVLRFGWGKPPLTKAAAYATHSHYNRIVIYFNLGILHHVIIVAAHCSHIETSIKSLVIGREWPLLNGGCPTAATKECLVLCGEWM